MLILRRTSVKGARILRSGPSIKLSNATSMAQYRFFVRSIYNGNHIVYPSVEWFNDYHLHKKHYQELINPMMQEEPLTDGEVEAVKWMLDDQARLFRKYGDGKVHLLNPLVQTLDQYLFGVPDILDTSNVKKVLTNLQLLNEDGSLDERYEKGLLFSKEKSSSQLENCTKFIGAVDSALNGVASRAMDTLCFANLWLYLGISSKLLHRPIVVLQSPKYHTRQIERYYGIIACMALGCTPVLIGDDSQGRPYYFEGMADVLPVQSKSGEHFLVCSHSSRTHMESYHKLEHIHRQLGVNEDFPKRFFVAELQDKFKELIFHLDLAMHVDIYNNLYLGENILQAKDEEELVKQIGAERVIYIPEGETKRYALNTVLYDERFGSSSKVAIVRDDCPVLQWELHKSGYTVYPKAEAFPHGGGSARCRVATFELGEPHTLESFLEEQSYIEVRLGAEHAVIKAHEVEIFKELFDESHIEKIQHFSNYIPL